MEALPSREEWHSCWHLQANKAQPAYPNSLQGHVVWWHLGDSVQEAERDLNPLLALLEREEGSHASSLPGALQLCLTHGGVCVIAGYVCQPLSSLGCWLHF